MPEPEPLTLDQIAELARRGMGKVDLWGHRGATMVSADEIVAMAAALALFGVVPIPPGEAPAAPIDQPIAPLKGPADV